MATEYKGQKVKLNDPIRNPSGSKKKFKVYVKDPKSKKVKKVQFGDPKMEIKRDDPERRKNFRARHQCDSPAAKDKTKAKYWSCYQWRKNKKVDSSIITGLVKIANQLDKKGLYKEADQLDNIIKTALSASGLIKALKDDDLEKAKYEFGAFVRNVPSYSTPAKELGISEQDFHHLNAAINEDETSNLERARDIMGIWGNVLQIHDPNKIDTNKINPFTGRPWPSGSVNPHISPPSEGPIRDFVRNVVDFVKERGGKIKMVTSEGADNLLIVHFTGLDDISAQTFEDVFDDEETIKDDKIGYTLVVGGIIDDGPDVGIEMEILGEENLKPSLLDYVKDLLK